MSDSRLEKFIYAICSMDVSDLPVPLSRIEKLWNCLITGETPDFEPLSRNEKYLMAMLDRYDISNLPAPMSRGEKLLYKIAVGETDLSDVPGYLSRYEELLKYLIENGGIGNFEYVLYTINQSLYTLYTTAEKPVKSAILKGHTLVNIVNNDNWVKGTGDDSNLFTQNISIKKGQTYTVIGKMESSDIAIGNDTSVFRICTGNDNTGTSLLIIRGENTFKHTFTNNENETIHIRFYNQKTNYKKLIIIEGNYLSVDIPYFEGMQSVKMPVLMTTGGKNFSPVNSGSIKKYTGVQENHKITDIKLAPNEKYTLSFNSDISTLRIFLYDETGTEIFQKWEPGSKTFQTNECENYYLVIYTFYDGDYTFSELQIEQGSVATPYEPYKSNILTVNEDVTLRGIGDVRDTLDCLTGEIIERIGEYVLNENITGYLDTSYSMNGYSAFRISSFAVPNGLINVICDRIKYYPNDRLDWKKQEEFLTSNGREMFIKLLSTKASTFEELKIYLTSSPLTIQYQLTTESIKTVDLTTVDQDGQPTKLKTFNDITYVEINADNLIPSVDVEVATKINETLSTLDPQQNDISNTQNKLGQTIDEQTENTDATMMATTEIYEQTL